LESLEAVKAVKYAYLRLLDLKEFEELGRLLTEDCTASYEDGRRELAGREAIVGFLTDALGDPRIVTQHQCHHPEISATGEASAEGTWYLQDRVIVPAYDVEISGTAFYFDTYVQAGEGWLISHTGYRRVLEEHRSHSTLALTSFRSRF
jgi:hypothetical protein